LVSRSPALFLRISTNPVERNGSFYDLTQNFIYILSLKVSALFFDKIFFISPMLGESCILRFGIPRSKVAVWPVAVDTHLFQERDEDRVKRLREELGLSGRLGVLYHGVISRGRGILETVEAFKILKNESVKATLILLGNGPAKKEIEQYVLDNHLEEVIKVCGPVEYSEVSDYIAACDVGIIPLPDRSWWWFQPSLKLLEYLALRKPVIVSDIPSNRTVVGNMNIASYLKGTSPSDIAEGIREFISSKKDFDPDTARRIAENFSVENVAKDLEQQILSVVS